jgi:hypothetical protein
MAIEMKDTAAIAAKYVQRAQASGSEYKGGVAGKGAKWAANTAASEDTYGQGVTAAVGRRAFSRGVAKAGAAKYETKAADIGATRYPQGVAGAGPAYQAGFEPYASVLKGVALAPRAPKGAPQNLERVRAVTEALHNKKISG